jgi:hypothetical protein
VDGVVNSRRKVRRPVGLKDAIGTASDIEEVVLRTAGEWRQADGATNEKEAEKSPACIPTMFWLKRFRHDGRLVLHD